MRLHTKLSFFTTRDDNIINYYIWRELPIFYALFDIKIY